MRVDPSSAPRISGAAEGAGDSVTSDTPSGSGAQHLQLAQVCRQTAMGSTTCCQSSAQKLNTCLHAAFVRGREAFSERVLRCDESPKMHSVCLTSCNSLGTPAQMRSPVGPNSCKQSGLK